MIGERWLYTLAMLCGAVAASWLLRKSQHQLSLTFTERWAILAAALVGAMVAAKAPFVFQNQALGFSAWFSDGKTVLWALTGGYVGVETAKWSLHIKERTGDTFVIAIAVAIAIGRLGCFTYGCCYGVPTELPWGVHFVTAGDAAEIVRHPTQIYEFIFHVGFAWVAYFGMRKHVAVGNWMPLYIISYAIYRFGSEFIRPEPIAALGLTFYQWSSLAIAAGMIGIILYRARMDQAAFIVRTRDKSE